MAAERNPTLAGVIRTALDRRLADMRTCTIGRVESYDATTGKCSILPLIQEFYTDEDGTRRVEREGVLQGVPVLFLGGGGHRATFPVAAGDLALVLFSDRSIDKWKALGGEGDPGHDHRFHRSDAVALVGIRSFNEPWDNDPSITTIGSNDGSADWVARATEVKAEISALRDSVADLVTKFNSHTHAVTTAPGTSAPPAVPATAPATVNDVNSETVKVRG